MAGDILDPVLVTAPHPFTNAGREYFAACFLPGETLGAYVSRNDVALPRSAFRVYHNGHPVPISLWPRLIPRTGDLIVIGAIAEGGGSGSKVLRTVAMVALVIASIKLPFLWGLTQTVGGATVLTSGGMLASGLIMFGGSILISMLLPPPQPTLDALGDTGKYTSSPTYSLSGGRNRMRPWEPMTVSCGRHKVVPDLAATPYVEYVGDDQYLNQVFHFGLQPGELTFSDLRIGATPLSNYQGVQTQFSGPDGKLTLFWGNVDTLQGFELVSQTSVTRTTPVDTVHITVDLAARLFNVDDAGNVGAKSVDLRLRYRAVGAPAWIEIGLINDPIYATHYWKQEIYERLPSGDLYLRDGDPGSLNVADHTDGEMYEISAAWSEGGDRDVYHPAIWGKWVWTLHPKTSGLPWFGVAPDPLIGYSTTDGVRMTGSRTEPTRSQVQWDVAAGQYEIQIWKVDADLSDTRNSNEVAVAQILCYQTDPADYTGQARVALRIKASGQLNGAVDEFSALVAASCAVWTGTQWAMGNSRNPADWFAAFAIGKTISGLGRRYGAGYAASGDIDFDSIKAWRAFCDTEGLTFDYVLDRTMDSDAVLQLIARAGRASVSRATGKLGVIWEAANKPVSAMFGPFNIKAGTFQVAYADGNTPDEILLNFANEDNDYTMDGVRVVVPGVTEVVNTMQLDLDGCTNKDMAGREANLIAAEQIFNRRTVTFETDIEGMTAHRGDIIIVTHDLTVWGYSGRVLARSGNTLTLSQKIPTANGTMTIRDPEGNMKTVATTGLAAETDTVTIVTDMTGFALPGDTGFEGVPAHDWAFGFDPLATPGRRMKVIKTEPGAHESVRYTVVDDDPNYYAAEYNPYVYTPPKDGALLSGIIFSVNFAEGYYNSLTRRVDVSVTWSISVDMPVDALVSINGVNRPAQRIDGTSLTLPGLSPGDSVAVTVTPVGIRSGTPVSAQYAVVGTAVAPDVIGVVSTQITDGRVRLRWPSALAPDVTDYEVRTVDTGWGDDNYVFKGDSTECFAQAAPAGVARTWYVRALTAAGLYSPTSSSIALTIPVLTDVTGLTYSFYDTSETSATITLDWAQAAPTLGLDTYIVTYGSIEKHVKSNTIILPADWLGDRTFTIKVADAGGNVSAGTSATVTKLAPNPPSDLRVRVIDNNVLLFWTPPPPTTLPVSHTLVKSGPTWATAQTSGIIKAGFATFPELEGGEHIYWFATVDTDGNMSAPASIVATVGEPPDFVFQGEIFSAFDGTKSSAFVDQGALLLPVDLVKTWETHFTSRTWASPADQVTAGFPLFLQPTPTPGTYTEVMDFGNTVPSSRVTLTLDAQTLAGTPVVATTLETSADGTIWTTPALGLETFAVGVRYVRVAVTVTQSGTETALIRINRLSVRLASKLKNDGGSTSAASTDTSGTIANFNVDFLDVASITLTPAGTIPLTAVYDFKDSVMSGTYSVSAGVVTVSITGHGLIAGQDVMLTYPTGPERVTITSATANSFTAPTTKTGSGSITAYPQSIRIYLFDNTGTRQSGSVSWSVRGN